MLFLITQYTVGSVLSDVFIGKQRARRFGGKYVFLNVKIKYQKKRFEKSADGCLKGDEIRHGTCYLQ